MEIGCLAGEATSVCPFDAELQIFWDLRHELFSRFDDGIRIDEAGLFGVKPESVALHLAKRVRGHTVLDALCGIGGTVIAFAQAGKRVITAEIDADRLEMARHNAVVYGVEDRITFLHDDIWNVMDGRYGVDAVYLDPPWGGPSAAARDRFGLDDFKIDARSLLEHAFALTPQVILSVPPNFDEADLRALGRAHTVEPVVWHDWTIYQNVCFDGVCDRPA